MLGKETKENQDTVMRHQSSQKDLLFKHHFQEASFPRRLKNFLINKISVYILIPSYNPRRCRGGLETWFQFQRGWRLVAGGWRLGMGSRGCKLGAKELKKAQCCTKFLYFNPKT